MSTGSVSPFSPESTVTIAALPTASVSATIASDSDAVLVYNPTNGIAFVVLSKGTATATSANTPVPPGAQLLLATGEGINEIAVILASTATAGNVYVTSGNGTQR